MIDPNDDIRDSAFHARLCCDFWWHLEGAHAQRAAILKGFESFPLLFETLRPALFTTFVVKICSLFGNGNNEITLKSLPNAQQDPEFARIWSSGRVLYRFRSKVIAHRDAAKNPDIVAKETGLTFDDLRELMDDVCALFDRVAASNRVAGIPDFDCSGEILEAASRLAVE